MQLQPTFFALDVYSLKVCVFVHTPLELPIVEVQLGLFVHAYTWKTPKNP